MVQLRAKLLKMKMLQDKAGALGDSRCMCPYTSYQKTEKQTERKLSASPKQRSRATLPEETGKCWGIQSLGLAEKALNLQCRGEMLKAIACTYLLQPNTSTPKET